LLSPCYYWRYCNPTLGSHGTLPRKVSNYSKRTFGVFLQRDGTTHCIAKGIPLTCDTFAEQITETGTVSIVEELYLITLVTSVEQLESKHGTLMELDTKIVELITDPEGLENEIFKAMEIQDTISEKTYVAKKTKQCSEQPQSKRLTTHSH